jgi:agmatine deiminase
MQPAEWELHRGCITAWPAHEYAWGEHLRAAQVEFVAFAEAFAKDPGQEPLRVLVDSDEHAEQARVALRGCGAGVVLERVPYGDVWLRDTAPIFLKGKQQLGAVNFRFNGWGEKYIYPNDQELGRRLAERHAETVFEADFVLEGGAVDVDGRGTCLTTRTCLLNDNRQPPTGADREDVIAERLADTLGVSKLIWLDEGLRNDHTDGHIDNIARFVAPGTVVCMQASGDDDPNRATLDTIAGVLQASADASGERLRVVRIPSPGRVLGASGEVVPASYMNFYIGNRTVLVPGFGTRYDEPARQALQQLFPGRNVVMSSARALLEGGGTFHCMTQQVPAP